MQGSMDFELIFIYHSKKKIDYDTSFEVFIVGVNRVNFEWITCRAIGYELFFLFSEKNIKFLHIVNENI